MEMEHLCMGCMRDKGDEKVCPYCGYSDDEKQIDCYLPSRTVIAKRFMVGKVLSYNGESVTYMGYDAVSGRRVRIREYFPDSLVLRGDDRNTVIVKDGCNITFKSCMSDFVDLMEQLLRLKDLGTIMRVWDIEYQNNTVYAILEHVDGMPLRQFLERRNLILTWEETLDIMRPVMKTVEALNDEGIIHRGIGIDTIWLGVNRTVKLDGFAISEVRAASTDLTPEFFKGFTAPEQYSAVSPHGSWTDVYGICAVLYHCLTGFAPADALIRSYSEALMPPREKNETVPQRASRAILQGLSMDINERIQTVSALIARITGDEVKDLTSEAPTQHVAKNPTPQKKAEPKPQPEKKRPQQPAAVPIKTSVSGQKLTPSSSVRPRKKLINIRLSGRWTSPILFLLSIAVALFVMYRIVWSFIEPTDVPATSNVTSSILPESKPASEPSSDVSEPVSQPEVSDPSSTAAPPVSDETSDDEEEYINMDNFAGKVYEEVIEDEEYLKKYEFGEPTEGYSDQYEEGQVMGQNVVAGNVVQRGTEIILKVSKGSRYPLIPYVEGMTKELYLTKLDELGILYTVVEKSDDEVEAGYVIGTDYLAGTKYDRESELTVEVYVSTGKKSSSRPGGNDDETSSSRPAGPGDVSYPEESGTVAGPDAKPVDE